MAPASSSLSLIGRGKPPGTPTKSSMTANADIVEAWAEGFQLGGLIILMLICICNLRRHVVLHKLILLEQFLASWKGVVIFFPDPVYGWFLSSTVVLLYVSYFLHNYISWMKIRPFLAKRSTIIYLGTLFFVQPYWAAAAWTNFEKFNGLGDNYYRKVRPWEAFAREPWWVFTTCYLVYVLKTRFDCRLLELIRSSPRFGVMIFCMLMSLGFLVADFVSVWVNLHGANGLNPFWRLALVFKCASDTIFLDDFKRVFDVLGVNAVNHTGLSSDQHSSTGKPLDPTSSRRQSAAVFPRPSLGAASGLDCLSDDETRVNSLASPSSLSPPPNSYEQGKRFSFSRNQSTTANSDMTISVAN